jgi:hypothetical protein
MRSNPENLILIRPSLITHMLAGLALLLSSGLAHAEQMLESQGYQLHYMAMVSSDLDPDVAAAYGITRSRKQGVLMLNLQDKKTPFKSAPSLTNGRIRNLIGQERLKTLREVREQDAIYWVADFAFSHLETMRFDFEVQPLDAQGEKTTAQPLLLKFNQQFYTPGR